MRLERKQSFRVASAVKRPSPVFIRQITAALLRWGPIRTFPWRDTSATPFQVLIAEILLTRTSAGAVSKVIGPFWQRFPTPCVLADSSVGEVRKFISPLGLTKRAEMLVASAKQVAFAGGVKNDRKWLLELPGVGRYVADAVRVLAFNEPVIPVDAVIGRVMRRVLGYPDHGPAYADRTLWKATQKIVSVQEPRKLVMTLLDLGAVICVPNKPKCPECPLRLNCRNAKNSR